MGHPPFGKPRSGDSPQEGFSGRTRRSVFRGVSEYHRFLGAVGRVCSPALARFGLIDRSGSPRLAQISFNRHFALATPCAHVPGCSGQPVVARGGPRRATWRWPRPARPAHRSRKPARPVRGELRHATSWVRHRSAHFTACRAVWASGCLRQELSTARDRRVFQRLWRTLRQCSIIESA